MQEHAEHIHGHFTLQPKRDQVDHRPSTAVDAEDRILQRLSTAVQVDTNGIYDAGAEADIEESPRKVHAATTTKTSRKRASFSPQGLNIAHHSKYPLKLRQSRYKRKSTALEFLDGYPDTVQARSRSPHTSAREDEPESLQRRLSKTSTPVHKKRKRIADKTYRAPTSSPDSDAEYIPMQAASSKKRRKIADPTYRGFELGSSTSSDENVVARKKGGKKRKVEGREGANLSVVEEDARCMEGDAARQDFVDGCVGSAVEGGGGGAPSENAMDMNIDADEGEEREGEGDAVGVKVWWNCSVM